MNEQSSCEFEQTVVKSLKSGFSDDETAEHIESCANCRETVKIMQFFHTNLIKESPPKKLPVAGLIWWKSRLREKRRAAERVNQPILIAQTIAAAVFVGVLFWFLTTDSFHNSALGSALNRVFASMEFLIIPFFVGIACLTFVCLLIIFTLRRFLLEK